MPRIRWKTHTKIQHKAIGLPKAPAYADVGAEMEVSAETLKAIEERYAGLYEVVSAPEPEKKERKTSRRKPE